MKKILTLVTLVLFSQSVVAQDLVLEGERWFGKFTGYVCADGNTPAQVAPSELARYEVAFGHVGADYSLDNVILKGTFQENGVTCYYSALLFADNAAWTAELVDSRAYSQEGVSCAEGHQAIDQTLSFNRYEYLHGRAALFIPSVDAEAACGAGAEEIALHLQVQGRHQ